MNNSMKRSKLLLNGVFQKPICRWFFCVLALLAVCQVESNAQSGLTYVDADLSFINGTNNLTAADGSDLSLTFNGTFSSPSATDPGLWDVRGPADLIDPTTFPAENLGASPAGGGQQAVFASGGRGLENSPELVQTLTSSDGLAPNTSYDVFAVYWSALNADWGVRAGFTSMPGANSYFNLTGNAVNTVAATAGTDAASALWTTLPGPNSDAGVFREGVDGPGQRGMFLAPLGSQASDSSGNLQVFIDDLSTAEQNRPSGFDRTWFDGVAYIPAGVDAVIGAAIDRDSGALDINFNSATGVDVASYSITSAAGALDAAAWNSLANGSNSSLDSNNWAEVTSSAVELSEAETPAVNGFNLNSGLSVGNVWTTSPYQDVQITLTLTDSSEITVTPDYTGTGVTFGSLDGDADIDTDDFAILASNLLTDVSGLSATESYFLGDLNRDAAVDFADFARFQTLFDEANGPGAFAAATAVPEPASLGLLALAGLSVLCRRNRRRQQPTTVGLAATANPLDARNLDTTLSESSMTTPRSLAATVGLALLAVFAFSSPRANAVELAFYDFEGGLTNTVGGSVGDAFISEGAFPGSGLTFETIVDGTTITDGLVMDDIRGNVFDLSGGGRGGNGSDGGVNLSLPVAGSGSGSWTVAMFLRETEFGNGLHKAYLFDNRNTATGTTAGANRLILSLGNNNNVVDTGPAVFNGVSWSNGAGNTTGIADDQWHHLAYTYDNSNQNLGIYLDGSPVFNAVHPSFNVLSQDIELGNEGIGGGAGGQEGRRIDDVRVFNTALSASEILTLIPQTVLDFVVDTTDGTASIVNNLSTPITFNYYQIDSGDDTTPGTSLDIAGWQSLDDGEGADPAGQGWVEAGGSSSRVLAEGNVQGSVTINPTESILLGTPFSPGSGQDLAFGYGGVGASSLTSAVVSYVTDDGIAPPTGGIPGDFNGDNVVDAADYTVWRDNLGATETGGILGGNGNGGTVDGSDYTLWKSNFGNTAATASVTAVPEPASLGLAMLSALGVALARRRNS